jgi:hypothetical protein
MECIFTDLHIRSNLIIVSRTLEKNNKCSQYIKVKQFPQQFLNYTPQKSLISATKDYTEYFDVQNSDLCRL